MVSPDRMTAHRHWNLAMEMVVTRQFHAAGACGGGGHDVDGRWDA